MPHPKTELLKKYMMTLINPITMNRVALYARRCHCWVWGKCELPHDLSDVFKICLVNVPKAQHTVWHPQTSNPSEHSIDNRTARLPPASSRYYRNTIYRRENVMGHILHVHSPCP